VSETYRDADLPQDLLRDPLGFFQHLIQGAAILVEEKAAY
jgi:hypothetical protein